MIMIKIKLLLFGILVSILNTSCSLERSPLDKFSEDAFWTSEENALLALTGIYKNGMTVNSPEYNPTDWWSYGGLVFLEFASDNAYDRRGSNSNFYKLSNGTLLPNNPFIKKYWGNSYKKIARCNRFLEGIDKLSASEEFINRVRAEARFIRATQYFYLSQYFGDVPLVLSILTIEEANTVSKATKKDVTDFIVEEFTQAAAGLPRFKDLSGTEVGRASKQASLAFLGRTLLSNKMYKEASAIYQEIISYGDNQIDPNYQSIFYPSNENSSENIFSMQYLQDMAGSGMPQHAFPVKDGGWSLINIPADLFESYQFTNGTNFSYENSLYDVTNLGLNRDPRLDYTIYYNGAQFKETAYDCHPDSKSVDKIGAGQSTQTGFLMRKFFDESYNGDLNSYGGNLPIIRYAEVLLSYLEAKIEAGEPITTALLDETINKVRGRSSVNMPLVTETNPDKLRAILRNERRVEFALEGIRYWDLLRWNIAHEKLNADVYGAPFPGAKKMNYKKVNGEIVIDKYDRWYVNKRGFRQAQDYVWPIPQSEQDINPNLR